MAPIQQRSLKDSEFKTVIRTKGLAPDNISRELPLTKNYKPWASIYSKEIDQPIKNARKGEDKKNLNLVVQSTQLRTNGQRVLNNKKSSNR